MQDAAAARLVVTGPRRIRGRGPEAERGKDESDNRRQLHTRIVVKKSS
jgi:hypothetical protein